MTTAKEIAAELLLMKVEVDNKLMALIHQAINIGLSLALVAVEAGKSPEEMAEELKNEVARQIREYGHGQPGVDES